MQQWIKSKRRALCKVVCILAPRHWRGAIEGRTIKKRAQLRHRLYLASVEAHRHLWLGMKQSLAQGIGLVQAIVLVH